MKWRVYVLIASLLLPLVPRPASAAFFYGDLVRRHDIDTIYYVSSDGRRYVFPHFKIYDTWYTNFTRVKFISAEELASIPFGGVVFTRPGTTMIKIQTDPRVYAVGSGGALRPIANEDVAAAIYGSNWNKKIIDLDPSFFSQYRVRLPIDQADDYDVAYEKHLAGEISYILARPDAANPSFEPRVVASTVPAGIRTNDGFYMEASGTTSSAAFRTIMAANQNVFARCERQDTCRGIAGPFTGAGTQTIEAYVCDAFGNCKRSILGYVPVDVAETVPEVTARIATSTTADPTRLMVNLTATTGTVIQLGIIRTDGPTKFCTNEDTCAVESPSLAGESFTYLVFACDLLYRCDFEGPTTVGPRPN